MQHSYKVELCTAPLVHTNLGFVCEAEPFIAPAYKAYVAYKAGTLRLALHTKLCSLMQSEALHEGAELCKECAGGAKQSMGLRTKRSFVRRYNVYKAPLCTSFISFVRRCIPLRRRRKAMRHAKLRFARNAPSECFAP